MINFGNQRIESLERQISELEKEIRKLRVDISRHESAAIGRIGKWNDWNQPAFQLQPWNIQDSRPTYTAIQGVTQIMEHLGIEFKWNHPIDGHMAIKPKEADEAEPPAKA